MRRRSLRARVAALEAAETARRTDADAARLQLSAALADAQTLADRLEARDADRPLATVQDIFADILHRQNQHRDAMAEINRQIRKPRQT